MPKLSKRTVDAIRPDPTGREVFAWDAGDGAIKGFGVRMMPSGAASYLVQAPHPRRSHAAAYARPSRRC